MKPRTVRRLCLVDGMNLDHIEGWLESMAARGLHYDHSDAFLFHFRRGEGMEHCRTLGWELTGYMGKGFSLFRTWEPDAPELHTDPVVRGYGLDKLARLVRWFATPMLICALVILALPLWLLLAWDEPVLSLVTGSGDNLFLCILSEWIAIYMSFRSFSSFFALRRAVFRPHQRRLSGRLLYLGGPQLCRPGSRAWHALGGGDCDREPPLPRLRPGGAGGAAQA